jgi:hypothetical protein
MRRALPPRLYVVEQPRQAQPRQAELAIESRQDRGKGTGAGHGAGERSTSSSWSLHTHMPHLPTDGKRLQEAEMTPLSHHLRKRLWVFPSQNRSGKSRQGMPAR